MQNCRLKYYMQLKLKILFLFLLFIYLVRTQITTPPDYVSIPEITVGKAQIIASLTKKSDGWIPYSVTFSKVLTNLPKKEAIVSLINFDSLTSNEFSFNTSISEITLSGCKVNLHVLRNSYFRLISLQYMAVAYSSSTPYLSSNCFLCSYQFISTEGERQVTFK